MAHLSGASGDACAARKLACTDSAQVEGRRRAGPERNPPPAHGRRREAALQMRRSEAEGRFGEAEPEGCASIRAQGGIPTKPCKPHPRMDDARGTKGGCAGMRRREAEGSRADCAAIERTSVAKWPQGAARSETQPRNAVAPVPTVADNAPAS